MKVKRTSRLLGKQLHLIMASNIPVGHRQMSTTGIASTIGAARIFDWGGPQTTIYMQ